MGFDVCCNKRNQTDSAYSLAPPNEREIAVQKYHSTNDSFFDEIETKYNILTYIQLAEYINLLENYSIETATLPFDGKMKLEFSSKDPFLTYIMSVDEFQSFIENKLLKISQIYELSGKNEVMINTFKAAFREIYNSLEMKLNQHFGEKTNDRITKKTLIPFGTLFSISNVVGKIKLIFDLFKDENENFSKSEDFDLFLLTSFLICSYCMISARRKISATNHNIPEMSKEDLIKCLGVCELKDCQNLVTVFNDTFFDKDSYNWMEFKEKFENKEKGFQWILSSRGIRKKLEENNV
jgi:hypothetical protein